MVLYQITQFESHTTYARKVLGQTLPFNNEILQLSVQEIFARNYAPAYNHATKSTDNSLSVQVKPY